jgi:hypothetical protein
VQSLSPPQQDQDKPKNLVIRKEGFKNLVLQKGANKEPDGRVVRINRIEESRPDPQPTQEKFSLLN